MQAIYHTSTKELSADFLEFLKKQFKDSKVDIVVRDADETDYLLSTQANRESLERSISQYKNHEFVQYEGSN